MTLIDFIKNNHVDYSFNRITIDMIPDYEIKVNVFFGEQLKKYIVEYGYLGYKHIELFGINNYQGINSDMVNKTLHLHDKFDKTRDLIAIEDQGEGDYYLVDSNDIVFRFILANNELVPQKIDLFEYILKRFLIA